MIVTQDVLVSSVCYQGAERAAATEPACCVVDVSAGNAETQISNAVIGSTVRQAWRQYSEPKSRSVATMAQTRSVLSLNIEFSPLL